MVAPITRGKKKSWKFEALKLEEKLEILDAENKELRAKLNSKSMTSKREVEAGADEQTDKPTNETAVQVGIVESQSYDKTKETKTKKEEVETDTEPAETSLQTLSISEKGEDSGENLTDTSQTSSLEIEDVNEEKEEDDELLGCPVCNFEFKELKDGCCPNCNEELA